MIGQRGTLFQLIWWNKDPLHLTTSIKEPLAFSINISYTWYGIAATTWGCCSTNICLPNGLHYRKHNMHTSYFDGS
ncbi:hypothetical protein MKX01_018299 [Papaver californicum]|nr:hypothetical protein MKX01_018299 [Papaver californicum]